jgi:hypothetical protein
MIRVNNNGVQYVEIDKGIYVCTYYFGNGYEKTITLEHPSQKTLDNLSMSDFID